MTQDEEFEIDLDALAWTREVIQKEAVSMHYKVLGSVKDSWIKANCFRTKEFWDNQYRLGNTWNCDQ